jgi:hypothetical protein
MADDKPDLCLINGDWTPTAVVPAGVTNIEAGLTEAGWHAFWTIGDPDGDLCLEVWERSREGGSSEYLLEVSNATRVSPFMMISSFPELMDLVARWAPAVQAATVTGAVRDLYGSDPEPFGLVELIAGRAAYGVTDGLPALQQHQEGIRRERDRRRRARQGGQPEGQPGGQP